ncbi:hypothetical protein F9C07_1698810 [Aspergillus flavus]|uniref:Uncharacterized protein n=2 Tax=Aspergillus flavus TaxID=5059 RepID=A0A7U2MJ49_ASPFN|nr:hypothetical protein BDV35DRAFT_21823 [Aspergillus flavus]QRD84684.1 hypothetical protein F9C07_1698810 [Aspergillus flavus]
MTVMGLLNCAGAGRIRLASYPPPLCPCSRSGCFSRFLSTLYGHGRSFTLKGRAFGSINCSKISLVLHCMLGLINFWFFLERLCMYLRIVFAVFPFHFLYCFCSLLAKLEILAYPNRTAAYSPRRSTIRNRKLFKESEFSIVLQ